MTNKSFDIVTSKPKRNDPYIYLYNNRNRNGKSLCIDGKPTDNTCNVLCNCVGWACARFNHIYNILTGYDGIKYSRFCCNAENFIEVGKNYGLKIGKDPKPGAIIVWQKGNTLRGNDGAGHVAVVEQVISSNKIITSESGYNSFAFANRTRTNDNGNWGVGGKYKFRGFIYNPAVTEETNKDTTINEGDNFTSDESKKFIFGWLIKNGFSEIAASGVMGCWEAESGNLADRIEGDYLKAYPGHDAVLSSAKSINDWTTRLFRIYANDNIGINKNAYKGSDGNYYAGMGLAQWTGPRAYNLIEYAKRRGKSFRLTEVQLSFFKNSSGELPSRKNLLPRLNAASSPEDAATIFLDGFEMYEGWHSQNSTGRKQNSARRENARNIYNSFSTIDSRITKPNPTGRNARANQIQVKISNLNVRIGNSTKAKSLGFVKPGFYNYTSVSSNEGKTWYMIGDNTWIAYSPNWCNIYPIEEKKPVQPAPHIPVAVPDFKVGDIVRMEKNAPIYGKNSKFASWVYNTDLYVRHIDRSRIVISIYNSGPVTGSVDKKYLIKK